MSNSDFKGKKYYQNEDVATEYDKKRFGSKGGKYIRNIENKVFLKLIGDIEDKKILDVATGTGRHAIDMAKEGAKVTGIDVSKPMIKNAREKAQKRNADIKFIQGDASKLPFNENEYDIVTCSRLLHLVDERKPFLKEMARVANEKIVCDFFSSKSLRLIYNWALPMGSTLANPNEMKKIFKEIGTTNLKEEKRFFIPYGAIRDRSGLITDILIKSDQALSNTKILKNLNSVIYLSGELK